MLTLLLGTDWTANRAVIMEMLSHDVANKKGKRILMVPELISHETERRLCAAAGDTTCLYAEVLSFSRLVHRVSEYSHCAMPDCMDNGGRIVTMASATRQLHSKLKVYAAVETKPEFLAGLVEAVDEFKRCCVTSGDLNRAAATAEGAFAQKLEELALILDAYDGLCEHGKKDPTDQMTWLLEQLEDTSFAADHVFYVDGFPDFNNQHMAILEHIIVNSPNIVISLNCDCPGSSDLAFEKAGQTAKQLLQLAQKNAVSVNIRHVDSIPTPVSTVCTKLFQGKINRDEQLKDHLHLCHYKSVYDECSATAQKIIDMVRAGARFRDMSIVCADMNAYKNIIGTVFSRWNIPFYRAGNDSILEKSVVVTVLSALEAVNSGFEQKDVLRYARSALSELTLQQSDCLENYVYLWNISGNRLSEEWKYHPAGLGEKEDSNSNALLAEINRIRSCVMEPLVSLQLGMKNAKNLSDQVYALYQFMEQTNMSDCLAKLAAQMDADGDNRNAQILNQLWEILLNALEQMHDALGHTVWDTDAFLRLFKLLLGQYDVGTIPTALDSVMVGPVNAMRCQKAKHVFVLGALEGAFPAYGGSAGVLTEQDRLELQRMGITLSGGALGSLQKEFSEIYSVFCGATKSIFVSCPSGQQSFIYKRLAELAGQEDRTNEQVSAALNNAQDAAAYLASHDAAQIADDVGIADIYSGYKDRQQHALGNISKDGIASIYGAKLNLSASQIDTQADCRLSYFLKYGLRIKERKTATVDPAEFGTYVHWVLEQTGRSILDKAGFQAVTLEETLEIAHTHSEQYIKDHFNQIESQRLNYFFARNAKELDMIVRELWQEMQETKFQPVEFELQFGDNGTMPAIPIPGKVMDAQLRGVVDRVDLWQNGDLQYYRVVDYKTGKKDFDYCDVFNGLGLQMLLYLFALKKEGSSLLGESATPVGVQYFPARAPFVAADGILSQEDADAARSKLWKRKGLLLSDDAVLEAIEPGEKPNRSFTRKRDGSLSGDLADRGQFNRLMAYVFSLVGRMVDDISSGCVEPNPYTRGNSHNACTYCPYGAVCNKANVSGRRNYKTMTSERFWEEVDKEVEKLG